MSMGLDEGDLPSDADLLRWVQARQATVSPHGGRWEVRVPRAIGPTLIENVLMGTGPTVHYALEDAVHNERTTTTI